ncbi:MAG: hypothetical protein RIQ40_1186, partial [Planctomycetota bacterium]
MRKGSVRLCAKPPAATLLSVQARGDEYS